MINFPILSLIIFLPLIGAMALLLFKGEDEQTLRKYRNIALSFSILDFAISLYLLFKFDKYTAAFQFEEKLSWIKKFNIYYNLGVDGIALFLVVLTSFLIIICILASWKNVKKRLKEYLIAFLILESLVIGVFCALDFILFYIFFEALLIPMFLIIGIWGGANRIYASYKFFLYTLAGSLFLLIAIIYIYSHIGSFDIQYLMKEVPKFGLDIQKYLWLAFFASFAVKVPMWPFHTWLPDAHVEAPTAGSIILAGILLKMGTYGFIRFSLPMLPAASHHFQYLIFTLSAIAVIYASLVAFAQKDIKKLIAYSSIAHMGFVTAGIFSFNKVGISGAIIQMISHGLISGGLFFSIGVIYDRLHTREIEKYGGIVDKMPKFALFLMILTMASVGLPGTSGFVGEFLVLLGVFEIDKFYSLLIATGMVFGAAYMLLLFKRSIFGPANELTLSLNDLEIREVIILISLIILIFLIGIYPKIITEFLNISVENLVNQINSK